MSVPRSLAAFLLAVPFAAAGEAGVDAADPRFFAAHVLPILEARCLDCHGEDAGGGLDLSGPRSARVPGDGGEPALVPGDAAASVLLRRVLAADDADRMPPDADPLPPAEIAVLRRWIDAGAVWPGDDDAVETHWAYVAPVRPAVPVAAGTRDEGRRLRVGDEGRLASTFVPRPSSAANPIDAFVRARLADAGLSTSPEAEPARLLRRVSLDLTGVPPTVGEVDRYLADRSPDRYERYVDRLLASPRFGERWATPWLDLARYADSHGYQSDQMRELWAYRDWVIDALNDDLPFDEFAVQQLAGDLLPDRDVSHVIATGFHRTPTCNIEAGVHPEENRTQQVFDRVNTTGTVFLGTTLECAQCHNHKYDPITTRDYYRLFAFFNNTPLEVENPSGKGVQWEFYGPKIDVPEDSVSRGQRLAERRRVTAEIKALQAESKDVPNKERTAAQRKDMAELRRRLADADPPTTLVMVEDTPRQSHVFRRGVYDDPGARVTPGTPAALHPWDDGLPADRAGLAAWLTSDANPLLARVTVNRWWAELFGRGIVGTAGDFGTRSAPPTHPDLLDWLAVEFRANGYRRKAMLRLMVTSATYRQSARVTAEKLAADPRNERLSRGPRFRLRAEAIRDAALSAAGLLTERLHGPPVMPSQPDGVWRAIGRNAPVWDAATDAGRFRRGVYVVWRRGAPYAGFTTFDAPSRESCTVDRPRTNTPLQALALLNDPAHGEAALALAAAMLNALPDAGDERRAVHMFRRVLTRTPTAGEAAVLMEMLNEQRVRFDESPDDAAALIDELDVAGLCGNGDPVELAAWFHVANVLLNLDEAVTR